MIALDHPHIARVKAYLDAANRHDVSQMLSAFSDDLVYRVPGQGPLSGATRGKAAAIDYFARIMSLTGGTYAITEIVDWLASDNRVALIANETATRNGKRLDWTRVVVFTFREELIVEVSLFDDKLRDLDELLTG